MYNEYMSSVHSPFVLLAQFLRWKTLRVFEVKENSPFAFKCEQHVFPFSREGQKLLCFLF